MPGAMGSIWPAWPSAAIRSRLGVSAASRGVRPSSSGTGRSATPSPIRITPLVCLLIASLVVYGLAGRHDLPQHDRALGAGHSRQIRRAAQHGLIAQDGESQRLLGIAANAEVLVQKHRHFRQPLLEQAPERRVVTPRAASSRSSSNPTTDAIPAPPPTRQPDGPQPASPAPASCLSWENLPLKFGTTTASDNT